MKTPLPPGWRVRRPNERILAEDRIDFNPEAPLRERFEAAVLAYPWESKTVLEVDCATSPADKPVVFTEEPVVFTEEPIEFSPKKLDALADDYFRKAEGGREDFSSREWIEIQELSGLALRRWAAQLRDEQKTQRARDKDCARLVEAAAVWLDDTQTLERTALTDEVHDAFMRDPSCLSEVPHGEVGETIALYFLFYAAAKRSGDL